MTDQSFTGNLITMLWVRRDYFPPEPFRDITFSSVLKSHNASNSQVSEVPKIVLRFFMMSEERSTAVENVVFFSKRCIVIKITCKSFTLLT